MKHICTILFDVDGTLMDTRSFVENAIRLTFNHFQLPQLSTEELFIRLSKDSNSSCLYAQEHLPNLTASDYWAVDHAMQEKSIHLCTLYNGVDRLLERLRLHNYSLAIVTNRTLKTMIPSLKHTGISHYFSEIVSCDDTEDRFTQFKPHPRTLEIAMERLGAAPQHSCIIGDTYPDIQAGKRAGVVTIGVAYGFAGQDISKYSPDYLIHSPEELLDILEVSEYTHAPKA